MKRPGMRETFALWMERELERSPGAMLLSGDLGFSFFDDWKRRFPAQYLNFGIAEQGMVSVASGLALGGRTPWVYSIAPFLVLRAFEQIKLDLAFPALPVRLIGVGAGTDYAQAGVSHYSLEDLSLIGTLPGFRSYSPESCAELEECLDDLTNYPGPAYVRLANRAVADGRTGLSFRAGGAAVVPLQTGGGLGAASLLISSGPRTSMLRSRDRELELRGIVHLHVARVQPFPGEELEPWLRTAKRVWVLEDQFVDCGLTSSVALAIARGGFGARLEPLGYSRGPMERFGSPEFLRKEFATDDETVWSRIQEALP